MDDGSALDWSPYTVERIGSQAAVERADATDEDLIALAGDRYRYVPIPESGEFFDAQTGERGSLTDGQVVAPDLPLLAAMHSLVDHPFLLVDPRRSVAGDSGGSGEETTEDPRRDGDESTNEGPIDPEDDDPIDPGDPADGGESPVAYRIVTRADLNRRPVEAAIYPVVSTLEERLATLIAREYPDPETLVGLVGPFPVGSWTKARTHELDVHLAEFLSLTDMVGILKGNDGLLDRLGYEDPGELESDLYAVGDLRNRVMHGNRSLVLDPDDVAAHVERIDLATTLIARLDADESGE